MESYSLYQVNEYIRRVIALNFQEPIWIEAEIAQARVSRGHCYLELVQKHADNDSILAQASAVIWFRNYQFIHRKIGSSLEEILEAGSQIRFKGKVDFNERYGLKFFIEDIDPRFTFGQLELERQEIIRKLQEEDLMDLNGMQVIPEVIQRIALITSANSAGHSDFINQLQENSYGYTFSLELFDVAVQGKNVESDTCAALSKIGDHPENFDIAIILRGGGSRMDLSAYDNYNIAKAVALSKFPVVVGIGHEIDQSVVDLVACLSLKTPTAVADFIIEQNLNFERRLDVLGQQLARSAELLVRGFEKNQDWLCDQFSFMTGKRIEDESKQLIMVHDAIVNAYEHVIMQKNDELMRFDQLIDSMDPMNVLKKGYAYIMKNKDQVRTIEDLQKGDSIEVVMSDGNRKAEIN